jgi:transglutaminase-like putative cysteine protease
LRRSTLFTLALVTAATAGLRADASPLLHERVPDDLKNDIAMRVTLDGDLPAALVTPSGLVSAPDPRRAVDPGEGSQVSRAAEGKSEINPAAGGVFHPDTDTRRPGLLPYTEPFTPSTAPFKRLAAYDKVDSAYQLTVADVTLKPLPIVSGPNHASEDAFFADIVVATTPGQPFRIPSVGPGARVLRAHFGSGSRDIPFSLWHDGADNWFIRAPESGRLVMEEAIARDAFGGELADPHKSDLVAPKLPQNVQLEANRVALFIGVDRTSPRRTLAQLVAYFRSFVDSDDPPRGNGSVYLDLALSKKGVCRHRAYAFTITALGLGIPARMITNEAHAWVEVYDGSLWRRIDLGGAGGELNAARDASVVAYHPPADPYSWPPDAVRGADLGGRGSGAAEAQAGSRASASSPDSGAEGPLVSDGGQRRAASAESTSPAPTGNRPGSQITFEASEVDVRRGSSLKVSGVVLRDGEPCDHVAVEVDLRDVTHGSKTLLGAMATDETGRFAGHLVVPGTVHTGDYELVAHTAGSASCGEGWSR